MKLDRPSPRDRTRIGRRLLAGFLLTQLAACCHPLAAQTVVRPLTGYISPNVAHLELRRALLLPTQNQTKHKGFEKVIHDLLATELRSSQLFHVVDCPETACGKIDVPQLCRGIVPMAFIAELRRRYHVDMIIASVVTEFQPYRHPKVGIDLHIIETANAETIASYSGVWDSRSRIIARQATRYFRSSSRSGALCNTELVLQSPRYFSEYVAHDLTRGLSELWNAQSTTIGLPRDFPIGSVDAQSMRPLEGGVSSTPVSARR